MAFDSQIRLWTNLTDEGYDELNLVHNFIEAPKAMNKEVKSRLPGFSWQLVQQHLPDTSDSPLCIPSYLNHEDMARLIGSSRQTVTTMRSVFPMLINFKTQVYQYSVPNGTRQFRRYCRLADLSPLP